MGFQIANDASGTPMLWEGSHWQARPVINREDLARASDPYGDLLWSVLTAVLAPDEATVERVAQELTRWNYPPDPFFVIRGRSTFEAEGVDPYALIVKTVLRALAGTSAQARHTDDDTAGGGAS